MTSNSRHRSCGMTLQRLWRRRLRWRWDVFLGIEKSIRCATTESKYAYLICVYDLSQHPIIITLYYRHISLYIYIHIVTHDIDTSQCNKSKSSIAHLKARLTSWLRWQPLCRYCRFLWTPPGPSFPSSAPWRLAWEGWEDQDMNQKCTCNLQK